ncbi:MAG: hypothetical protein AAGA31_18170 [Bacteroidota bacterium]
MLAEFARLDRLGDSEEKEQSVARAQDAMDGLKARQKKYKLLQEQLADSEATQISLIDPDARSLIKHGRESLVGYNIQAVVDTANKLMSVQ